jgi:[ribosomal protein S18]-alanine N-acetyltransferase
MNSNPVSGIQIQRASPADAEVLIALENRCFDGDRIRPRSLRRLLRVPTACCLVARNVGRLCGALVLLFRSGSKRARIYSLAVDPAVRGQGIAAALLVAAEEAARGRGCKQLTLEVRLDNVVARRLYEKAGFSQSGIRLAYYEDGAEALSFRKELKSGPHG